MRRLMQTPYDTVDAEHPVFVQETRRISWGESAENLRRRTLTLIAVIVGIIVVMWEALTLLELLSGTPSYVWQSIRDVIHMVIACMSLLSGLYLDYVSVITSVNSINSDIVSGRWDLLQLTSLRSESIVHAKHAAAQVRVWKFAVEIVGLRLAVVVLVALRVLLPLATAYPVRIENYFTDVLFPLAAFVGLAAVFVLEPLWRMRAMTALGLVVSTYTRAESFNALAAMGAMVVVWLLQLVAAVAITIVLGALLSSMVFVYYSYSTNSDLVFWCISPLMLIFVITALYGFYVTLQAWSLRRVIQRLAMG